MARDLPTANLPNGDFRLRYPLSKNERMFFDTISRALNKYCVIFPKVRLCDIILNTDFRDFSRIRSKHVDFLVCYRDSLKPAKVIELDDESHNSRINKAHDMVKDFFLNRAGIPVLHYPASRNGYNIDMFLKAYSEQKADTNMPYPILPVDVEVEEVFAYTEPDAPEVEIALTDNCSTLPQQTRTDVTPPIKASKSTAAKRNERNRKYGIMERIVFLFSGELNNR